MRTSFQATSSSYTTGFCQHTSSAPLNSSMDLTSSILFRVAISDSSSTSLVTPIWKGDGPSLPESPRSSAIGLGALIPIFQTRTDQERFVSTASFPNSHHLHPPPHPVPTPMPRSSHNLVPLHLSPGSRVAAKCADPTDTCIPAGKSTPTGFTLQASGELISSVSLTNGRVRHWTFRRRHPCRGLHQLSVSGHRKTDEASRYIGCHLGHSDSPQRRSHLRIPDSFHFRRRRYVGQ